MIIGDKLLHINLGEDFSGSDTKSKGNKSKNKQVGLHQAGKLLHSKGNKKKRNLLNGRKYLQITYKIRN